MPEGHGTFSRLLSIHFINSNSNDVVLHALSSLPTSIFFLLMGHAIIPVYSSKDHSLPGMAIENRPCFFTPPSFFLQPTNYKFDSEKPHSPHPNTPFLVSPSIQTTTSSNNLSTPQHEHHRLAVESDWPPTPNQTTPGFKCHFLTFSLYSISCKFRMSHTASSAMPQVPPSASNIVW